MDFSGNEGLANVLNMAASSLTGPPQVYAFESFANIAGKEGCPQYEMWANEDTMTLIYTNANSLIKLVMTEASDEEPGSSLPYGMPETETTQEELTAKYLAAIQANSLAALASLCAAPQGRPECNVPGRFSNLMAKLAAMPWAPKAKEVASAAATQGCPNLPVCIWNNDTAVEVLVAHARGQDNNLQVIALRGLGNLVKATDVRLPFWTEEHRQDAKHAILYAARLLPHHEENERPRQEGLCALRNEASDQDGPNGEANTTALRVLMLKGDDGESTLHALVQGAGLEGLGNWEAKSCALEAIMYLARARDNQRGMLDYEGLVPALVEASDERGVSGLLGKARFYATAALQELSKHEGNKKDMWAGATATEIRQ